MKTTTVIKTLLSFALIFKASVATTHAASFALTNTDTAGTTSFTNKQNWNTTTAPGAGNTYSSATFGLRTPIGVGNITFAGDSLTLATPTTGDSLTFKGDTGNIITINNLIMAGGSIANGANAAGTATTETLAGNINVTANSRINTSAASRNFLVTANITNGVSSITNQNAGAVHLLGNNSGFSGRIVATTGVSIGVNDETRLGGNPAAFTADQLLLDNGNLLITNAVTLDDANRGITITPNNAIMDVSSTGTLTVSNSIAGAGQLTKRNAGTLILAGSNTNWAGRLNTDTAQPSAGNDGIVKLTSPTALGSVTNIQIRNQNAAFSTLQLDGTISSITVTQILTWNGRNNATPAIQNVIGNNTISPVSVTFGSGGTLYAFQSDTNTLTVTGALPTTVPATARTLVFQGNGNISVPAILQNGTGGALISVTKSGSGTTTFSGANTFSGTLSLNGGVLNFSNLGNLGATPAVSFAAGTLQWAGGNTADISSLPATITFNAGDATLDVGANNVSFANGVGNGGIGGLTKIGSGSLTLNNANSYSGSTVISNGTLALGAAGSIASSTNISVRAGATFDVSAVAGFTLGSSQTLSGNGTVLGSVADSSGTIISPGTSPGTLTVSGGLALNGGGNLNFELSTNNTTGSGSNDLIVVTGALNLAGATALNISYLNGTPSFGTTYTIIQYGSFAGSLANLTLPPGLVATNNTGINAIQITIAHPAANLTWHGDGAGNAWDETITANWLQSGTNQVFYTGDTVTFNNSGSNNVPVALAGAMSPAAVIVNASQDYTFTGGTIASGSLTKSGAGALVLDNDNSYSGATVVSGGTLQIGSGGITGKIGTGPLTNNASLVFNRGDAVTFTNVINGSGSVTDIGSSSLVLSASFAGGSVTMDGAGALYLTASNTYNGLTVISAGSIHPQNNDALGTTAGSTIATNGGQLYIDSNIQIPGENLTLGGGALRKGGGGVTALGGAITLVADTTIHNDGNSTLVLTNAGGLSGAGFNLTLSGDGGSQGVFANPFILTSGSITKVGAGTWTLPANMSYSGKTFCNGGTLLIVAESSLGGIPGSPTPDYVTFGSGALGVTNNQSFTDGNRGFAVTGNGTFNVANAAATLTISNDISGAAVLTKQGAGTLALIGTNSFTGTLNVDTSATGGSDGALKLTTSAAIAGVTSPIYVRNNNSGSSTLQLDGSSGSFAIAQDFNVTCRNNGVAWIQNLAGNNTLSGNINLFEGGATVSFQSDAGLLTMSGTNQYVGALTGARTYTFLGAGNQLVSGPILNSTNGAPISVTVSGSGRVTLAAANTYGNTTTVNSGNLHVTGSITSTGAVSVVGGTLSGTGVINASVSVGAAGTLSAGASIGTLSINNNLSLAGTNFVEVNKTANTSDLVTGVGAVTYGGTLVATNLSGTLVAGDSFTIFSAATPSGNFASIVGTPGAGLVWSFNPASGVLSVVAGIPSTPTNITYSVTGDTLSLGWPANYLGWILQSQTNALNVGIVTNNTSWFDWPGSTAVTATNITINPVNPTVFFRLRHP